VAKKIKNHPLEETDSTPTTKQTITQVAFTGPLPHPSAFMEVVSALSAEQEEPLEEKRRAA
jgi:hypothetical protein